jgi:uncharacterized protein
MLVGLFLGLAGSFGHCVGMCSGIAVLLGRGQRLAGGRLLAAHLGRITTYTLLGALVGMLGGWARSALVPTAHSASHGGPEGAAAWAGLVEVQAVLALLAALSAVYLAFALLGRAPSPEIALGRVTRLWAQAMRRAGGRPLPVSRAASTPPGFLGLYGLGLLWGLLPCGLVLTALLVAAAGADPLTSGLTMLAFGLGTWPALLGIQWLSRFGAGRSLLPRQVAAAVTFLFAAQMALRGAAALGRVGHLNVAGVALW